MKKRFCILFTAILTGLIFLSVGTLVIAAPAEPDKVIEIEIPGVKAKKPPVLFDHVAHTKAGAKCVDCHHTYKEGDKTVQKCTDCHKLKNTKQDGKKIIKIKNAYHKNCKNCHKKNKKGPYRKCTQCHVKK